ncbi:LOW QUALITY PROTEIN: glutamate carboxypeptidase 2 homolog [Daphnia magna]|uniref:LOW QUALITY PROTEIN: glutamate carboxypeptidase 2 homolog n=1 Tax=Daphnia magna TaxID=35525 RepID=UPI001E1BA44A|nr:LOW QUALITY PROTEIN: glutamate carboxypeptidase 2 homolog [Daphnia magna]
MANNLLLIGFAILYVATGIAIGVGLYYAGYNNASQSMSGSANKRDVFQYLQDEFSSAQIESFLKHLSNVPHLAETEQDRQQAEGLRDQFLDFGLDQVTVVPYHVLLSYPDMKKPNKVYIVDSNGVVNFTSSGKQTPLYSPEEKSSLVAPNFNAYSGTGTVTCDGLVYVHFGQEADYEYLAVFGKRGIDVSGKIVLARRKRASFRGNIANLVGKKGASGVLLYSDPKEFAKKGRNETYPDSWWMPVMAVQSGTIMLGNGDPITPFSGDLHKHFVKRCRNCLR